MGTTANLIEQPPTSTNIYTCKVLNSCTAIHTVNNKSFFRQTLQLQAPHLIPKLGLIMKIQKSHIPAF